MFLGSKITVDSDCNHEIKRRLLLGRKAMINLESEESESLSVISDCLQAHGLYSPWNSSGQNTGELGSHSLLQGLFPTQGSNPGLLHCRWIFYHRSTREAQEYWSGQPIPSPVDLPDPGIEPKSPALQADFSSAELPMKPMINLENVLKSRDITLPTNFNLVKAMVFPWF